MTKPQWEIDVGEIYCSIHPHGDTELEQQRDKTVLVLIKAFIRAEKEKSYQQGVEDMRRKCVEAVENGANNQPLKMQDATESASVGYVHGIYETYQYITNLIKNVR